MCAVFGAPDADGAVADFIKKSHNLKTPKATAPKRQPIARRKAVAATIASPRTYVVPASPPRRANAALLTVPSLAAGGPKMPPPPLADTRRPEQRLVAAAGGPMSYSSDFSTGADHYFDSHMEYPADSEQVHKHIAIAWLSYVSSGAWSGVCRIGIYLIRNRRKHFASTNPPAL